MQSLEIAPLEIMHLLCDKLHIFESANEKHQRFLTYRTADGKEIIIIQQEWIKDTANDWITLNHMMIPTAFLPNMFRPNIHHSTAAASENIQECEGLDYTSLPLNLRKIFFQYECKRIPCAQNQQAMCRDIDALENKWGFEETESPISSGCFQDNTVSSSVTSESKKTISSMYNRLFIHKIKLKLS